jgi:hypothetical protein
MCTLSIIKPEENKSVCDGLRCSEAATITIEEEVCDMGVILLHLCDSCVLKFSEQ